jgi:hypothetical protein
MGIARRARPDSLTNRQAVPVVARRPRSRRHHGIKLAVGLGGLVIVGGVSAVAGISALQAIGEGDGVSAVDEYLDGNGVTYESDEGRFRAELPETPSDPRESTIEIVGGEVPIRGVQAALGGDRSIVFHVSWFDLPNAPAGGEAAGLLAALSVFHAQEFGATPSEGGVVDDSRLPAYEYLIDMGTDEASGEPLVITVRLVVADSRVYVLWVESEESERELVARLADSFEPRT